ncbi:hypothetical protein NQ314_015047 [Rhamnusium bicolor]|uniref:Uncharacterized protein n=1 Tax=Rhamnusium bicolor TaxID=1586634 RepID=A0AAV8X0E1_9CUCU|nr:hypothetical protein NQ314_015047 [Rhamnusium bicolor]
MCISKINNNKCKMINRSKLGRAVRGVLTRAKVERRLICGLLPAIGYLEKSPEDVVFCVLPQTRPGDAATHIQTVLLQAFCYENYIPVIQTYKDVMANLHWKILPNQLIVLKVDDFAAETNLFEIFSLFEIRNNHSMHAHGIRETRLNSTNIVCPQFVDSSEKLGQYCGLSSNNKSTCNCAIIIKDASIPITPDEDIPLSPTEKILADFL